MFESTTTDGQPIAIRVSFWQCFKAGVAFTAGVLCVSFVAGVLYFAFILSFLAALSRAR